MKKLKTALMYAFFSCAAAFSSITAYADLVAPPNGGGKKSSLCSSVSAVMLSAALVAVAVGLFVIIKRIKSKKEL